MVYLSVRDAQQSGPKQLVTSGNKRTRRQIIKYEGRLTSRG